MTLTHGRVTENFGVEDAHHEQAVPALRVHMAKIRATRRDFDATADSPDVTVELPRQAVFRSVAR